MEAPWARARAAAARRTAAAWRGPRLDGPRGADVVHGGAPSLEPLPFERRPRGAGAAGPTGEM